MGRTYAAIDDRLASFIQSQPLFFVASAPLSAEGLVNCSPKSNDGELTVIDPHRVGYLDRTGSGVETIAHLRENGRIVLMFCAFQGPPRIVRIHGRGSVVERDDEGFDELAARFASVRRDGVRAVIVVTADRIADSCGYGVPLMDVREHRRQLTDWTHRKGDEGIRQYWETTNAHSLDSLPALRSVSADQLPHSPTG